MKIVSKTASISKREIQKVPFQLAYEEGKDVVEYKKSLGGHGSWLLPQALAAIGTMKPVKVGDKYSGKDTIIANMNLYGLGAEWTKGLIFYLTTSPRGTILPHNMKATHVEMLPYAANVPLFLAAFKKYQNINYMDWDLHSLKGLVDANLWEAMNTLPPDMSKEDLLACRLEGCRVRTGTNANTYKNPATQATSILPTPEFPEFNELGRMAKIILCQVWVAHPVWWNKYMISDLVNFDNRAESLVTTEVVKSGEKETDPWDIPGPSATKPLPAPPRKIYDDPWDEV